MTLAPIAHTFPPVNPAPGGLLAAVSWQPDDGPPRWGPGGVLPRVSTNFGGEDATGVWDVDWLAAEDDLGPGDIKDGERPDEPEDPFPSVTVYGFDWCNPSEPARAEVEARARQNLRLMEPLMAEGAFADRLLDDTTSVSAANIIDAVSQLENMLARTNTMGVIHASTGWAAIAANAQLVRWTSVGATTPLGHRWVFGGGYIDGLGANLVATSPVVGWRTEVTTRDSLDFERNRYVVIAERAMVLAYEAAIGAVVIN